MYVPVLAQIQKDKATRRITWSVGNAKEEGGEQKVEIMRVLWFWGWPA